jgi:hypothetical protein
MFSSISAKEWESKSALLAHLNGISGRTVVLGTEAEAPRKFYSFAISCDEGVCELGVLSSGLGTKPDVTLLQGNRLAIVGHDTWVTWLNLHDMTLLASQRLEGVFYEFVDINRSDELLVLHELGVARVDVHGSMLWSVHTDIVEQASFDAEGNLVITVMEEPAKVMIEVDSGIVLRREMS